MFKSALEIASKYTWPIVLSIHRRNNHSSSAIGTMIVVNNEGWFITAAHTIAQFAAWRLEVDKVRSALTKIDAINADANLNPKQKRKEVKAIRPAADAIDAVSVWPGRDGVGLSDVNYNTEFDLAWGRLDPWQADWVEKYPIFKGPNNARVVGASLCKYGFPFHQIVPQYDSAAHTFTFPTGALPLPLFPIDGIYSRTALGPNGKTPDGKEIEVVFLETSSPGLMGQSGGPTIDPQGRVWAMQSQTMHLDLGFEATDRYGRKAGPQFLHCGLGLHCETIVKVLNSAGVKIDVSSD